MPKTNAYHLPAKIAPAILGCLDRGEPVPDYLLSGSKKNVHALLDYFYRSANSPESAVYYRDLLPIVGFREKSIGQLFNLIRAIEDSLPDGWVFRRDPQPDTRVKIWLKKSFPESLDNSDNSP